MDEEVRGREKMVRGLLSGQYGVISRSQAASCGLTRRMLQHRLRPGGPWQRLLPGVYQAMTGSPGPDQLDMAALLYAGDGSLVTGLSALSRHRLGVPRPKLVEVLIPAGRQRASRDFVALRRTTRMPPTFFAAGPIWFTRPPRAVADAARTLASLAQVRDVVARAVQQDCCTVAELRAELDHGPHRGSGRLRAALAEVSDGVRSPAEADFRTLIRSSGLPLPLFNPRLYLRGTLLAVPDAWWPRSGVIAEVDSREWHLSPASWEATMRRHARIAAAGVLVLHFSPRQIRSESAEVLAALAAALQAGTPATQVVTRPAA